jgi:hypothetical protein
VPATAGKRRIPPGVGLLILLAITCSSADAATRFDPALKFRVMRTSHFRIYFHQGGDGLAARLARIAEDAWRQLERPLGIVPPPVTHVVLADQTDLPNGYATPLPYDTIVIFPTWPPGSEFDTDDWLRLVFTHEFTHIVHLDRSESWARVVRGIFGRTFIAFPNLFLPTWQIEGLATFEESSLTGEGRLHAGEFRAIVDEAARARSLQPLDRVNGGLTDWPGGQAPYAYGAAFHEYLADRFGVERLAALAEATARRVPYTAAPAFSKIFGQSLGSLWKAFEAARTANAAPIAPQESVTRLTRSGFVTAAPRFDRACDDCPPAVIYSARTPDEFPSLKRVLTSGGLPTTVATRYFGATTAVRGGKLYFDQLEVSRSVGLYGDLYELSRESGHVARLTRGARLHDPDLSPNGSTIVAVQENRGGRALVLLRLEPGLRIESLSSATEVQFNAPRWSPDGRHIAAERHRLGTPPEIVIVDVMTRTVNVVIPARADTRVAMPSWRPDGRALLVAVATGDRPFNIVEFDLDLGAARILTHLGGGGSWPEFSPDGRTIVFVGYTTEGYDLFAIPYPKADVGWDERPPMAGTQSTRTAMAAPASPESPPATAVTSNPYSPLPTLKPTSWSPIIESDSDQVRVGAETTGSDVLGYHFWVTSATWLVASPSDTAAPDRRVPDWFVSYAYDRWQPVLFASASAQTSFFAGPATSSGTPSTATRRERVFEGGVLLPMVRARRSHLALATFFRSADEYTLIDRNLRRDRAALRSGWQTTTARTYGYSISPEDGIVAGATGEFVRSALGATADATTITGDLRFYAHGLGRHHVVAGRLAGGASRGDQIAGRTFVLGGSGPDASVLDFGSGAISVLRGFPSNSFAGSHVALAQLEYRFPLVRPQRGIGTWPLFLHTVHASAFGDFGHAWTSRFTGADMKSSFGGELSANVVAGYYFPFTLSVGAALGHDGSGTLPDRNTFYVRLGRSF